MREEDFTAAEATGLLSITGENKRSTQNGGVLPPDTPISDARRW